MHEHELLLSDSIYLEVFSTQIYAFQVLFICFFHFDLEKFISKNCKYVFLPNICTFWAKLLLKIVILIIVVYVHETVLFSKVHPVCHNIANGIKPGSDSKRLISMLWIAKKLYVGA